jgi:hypothetical protein
LNRFNPNALPNTPTPIQLASGVFARKQNGFDKVGDRLTASILSDSLKRDSIQFKTSFYKGAGSLSKKVLHQTREKAIEDPQPEFTGSYLLKRIQPH